jgi:hypothetical protein
MKIKITVILLLAIFVSLAYTSMVRKSATCDEVAHHIPSGYIYLTKHDLRFATDSPPLARYIAALPMLFMDINLPGEKTFWRREDRGEFAREFFNLNIGKYKDILKYSRTMILMLSMFGGLILYLWTKSLYSKRAGILTLFLYCLSPNILAHARLATTDVVVTVFILLFAYMFWQFLQSPGYGKAVIAGIFFGLALLSKYSALLILPIILVFFFIMVPKQVRVKKVAILFLVFGFSSFLTLWAGYGFEVAPLLADTLRAQDKFLIFKDFCSRFCPFYSDTLLNKILYSLPVPLSSYILGVLGVIKHGADGHSFFFLGNYYMHGLPCYYIVAFLIKTPLALIIAFLSGVLLAIKKKPKIADYYMLSFITVFFIAASFSKLQLGIRYILPIYPFCFIIAGRFLDISLPKRFFYKIFAVLLLIWYSISSFFIWPDYIAYFNELIGGSKNGYKYLRDSGLDWGQDLPALKEYMDKNGVEQIRLAYHGEGMPETYGINYNEIKDKERIAPDKNVYAISVMSLDSIQWTKNHKPISRAGYSIFIYDFR